MAAKGNFPHQFLKTARRILKMHADGFLRIKGVSLQMKKILLLNPPGDQLYLRDYFCSKISKSGYIYQPTDLLILSGILSKVFDVHVLDCIVEGISHQECFRRIENLAPSFVIFITGSVSFSKDVDFIRSIKEGISSIEKIVGIGDIFFENYKAKLENHCFIDAILYDFTTDDILEYLQSGHADNLIYKKDGEIHGEWKQVSHKEFSIPIPRYDLFPNTKYNYPFCRKKPFAVVLTNFGCPFHCRFCIMPALGFKMRNIENILDELRYLKKNGFKNIYFNDQTFGADKKRTSSLLEKMIEADLNMGWVCFSRVDLINPDFVELMKKAGCHTILFGVESSNAEILKRYNKGITPEKVRNAVKLCKQNKIRTLGTFILGLPGETKETAMQTIEFAKDIDLDYAAFNIAIPRMGTELREEAVSNNLVSAQLEEMDQSGYKAVINNGSLTLKDVEDLKHKAYRAFYNRPRKILRLLLDIRSKDDLLNHIKNGWGVFARLMR